MIRGVLCSWCMLMLSSAAALAQAPADVVNQARMGRVVTPADNTPLSLGPTRGLYVGAAAACAIAVILADDTAAVTFAAVPSGTFMPIRAKVVMATGTTCTSIVGLW